jgi:hypothetical protein
MISKQKTLKLIKSKVDTRKSRKIKLPKSFQCSFVEGVFKHIETRKVTSLIKSGNSVLWVDENHQMRNISILSTSDLHKIMWQVISDKEKNEIALEHLLATKTYLED